MDKPEALRLADWLEDQYDPTHSQEQAAAELRRLHADAEENEALRERLSELLRGTAIALRGPEPALTRWSWHDLPDLAYALKAQRDELLTALRSLLSYANVLEMRLLNADGEHRAMQQARAAIKAVEGETNEQPEALRLADVVERNSMFNETAQEAAAELRRLHASCEDYAQHKQRQDQRILALYAQRDALLEALAVVLLETEDALLEPTRRKARAAIKAVEGEKE